MLSRINVYTVMVLGWCSLLVLFNKDALAIIDIFAFAYVTHKDKTQTYASIAVVLLVASLLCIITLLQMGGIKNEELNYNYKGHIVANTMGMTNPNVLGEYFFFIISFVYYFVAKQKYKYKVLACIGIIAASVAIYFYCYSRTFLAASLILVLLTISQPIIIKFRKLNRFLYAATPIVVAFVAVFLILNSSQYDELDEVATNRLAFPAMIVSQMSLLNWIVGIPIPDGQALDCSYLMLVFQGGLPIFLLTISLMVVKIWKKYAIMIELEPLVLSILAYGITENIFSSFNPLSAFFFSYMFFPRYLSSKTSSQRIIKSK